MRERRKRDQAIPNLVGGLFAVAFILALVLWPASYLFRLVVQPAIATWYTQPGRVEQVAGTVMEVYAAGRRPPFCARVVYVYQPPGDTRYHNSVVTPHAYCLGTLDHGQTIDAFLVDHPHYRPGSPITVYFSRDHPSIAMLGAGEVGSWYFVLYGAVTVILLAMVGVGLMFAASILAYVISEYRKDRRAGE